MIVPPTNVRVWLANGHTDMRRYAECVVMRSSGPGGSSQAVHRAVPLRIISASTGVPQHRQQLIGHLELSSLQAGRRHCGEGFQFLGRVCS